MTQLPPIYRTLRERFDASRASRRTRVSLMIFAVAASFALTVPFAIAPPAPPTEAAALAAYATENAQDVDVSTAETVAHLEATDALARDDYGASQGLESLIASGTNHDWAKMVCLFAGFPMSDANVTVITRWMRQENYTDSWWNRNNPLNNGYGSGGGAGLGSYPDLVTAAEYCAKNLQRGYPGIVAGLEAGNDPDATAAAIWASPWASSHYANGAHWSTRPVEIVQAPASAWGQ